MSPALTFLGAAGTVTGSKFLLEAAGADVLLECGMFQGSRELADRNWTPSPIEPGALAAVVLSHAHLDHSGYLPRLVRDGFDKPIYCSPGTADLLRIMLPDEAHLEEEEAQHRNRIGATRHRPALPLFTAEDAARALSLLAPVPFGTPFRPAPGLEARLSRSGHILGASVVQLTVAGRRLVYSGDLGRDGVPLMQAPEPVALANTLLVESTYGDRVHTAEDPGAILAEAVTRTARTGGWLLVPAFAVGRAQEVLCELRELEAAGRIPTLPVYLDSPMAIEATRVYAQHREEQDLPTLGREAAGTDPLAPPRLELARTVEESKRLNDRAGPAIVLAGSGMATGGRILHHLQHRLAEASTTVLFVGYQAAGTLGRRLEEGARTVRIFGQELAVNAMILSTGALSAHADRDEILDWLRGFERPPEMTYTIHGEPRSAQALAETITKSLGWPARPAEAGERISL